MRQIYDEHYDAIFQYIFYCTNRRALAEDLVQETFLKYFQSTNADNPKAYLYRIARNLVYDYYRKKRRIQWIPLLKDERVGEEFPEDLLEKSETTKQLYDVLSNLKIHYRETIILRYIEELSVKEVASVLGHSEVKVKNNTARGLKALRKILGGDWDGVIEQAEITSE